MRISVMSEIRNKHSVDSQRKGKQPSDIIPDEVNVQTCLNCPLPRCKPRCGRIKREKK